jgi:hypothetical protein
VVLVPELVGPNDGHARSPLSLVPPGRIGRKGRHLPRRLCV